MKSVYEKYAGLLVNYSLELKKGDKLLIVSTCLSEPLIQEVYREALRAGAHPETWITVNGITRMLYDEGNRDQLEYASPLFRYAVENYQAFLTIRAPFNVKELQTADPEKKKKVNMAEAGTKRIFRKRATTGDLRWTLCEFPTDAQAQECGLSRKEYEEFILSACFIDHDDPSAKWREVRDSQQRIVDFLNKRQRIRYKGRDIDVSFSTEGRTWINSDGKHNMPSGEIFTSPVEDSVEGSIRFSYPGIFMGQEIEDVRLEVYGGRVVRSEAAKGKGLLDQIINIPGADRFGEAAIGTNKGITRFTRNMLFDEKIGGTIHMALGSSYGEAGGKNESSVHWDLLADMTENAEIHADGEIIYRNGEFLI
ncbi:MAG: Aminopeptidase 2 [Syntrophorhabdaceae bacterium PtaU1.Bin034]|jgi:aminopeptidase|nr:MAG: Aminopeptidase 2 [Syntrophorhabdaceae bacterium PtaU1.Bin034]